MPSLGTGYGDRRRDRSEGTIRVGSVWPIATETVTPVDELLLDAAMRCDIDEVDAAIAAKANATADGVKARMAALASRPWCALTCDKCCVNWLGAFSVM